MNNKFVCDKCKYVTNRAHNLKKHMSTKKHKSSLFERNEDEQSSHSSSPSSHSSGHSNSCSKKNTVKKFKCIECGKSFADKSNMYRHRKLHQKGGGKVDELIETNKKLEKQNERLLDLVAKNADTANIATKNSKQSTGIMNYAIKNFTNAPAIKLLEKDDVKQIAYDKEANHSLEELLVFNYKENLLDKFLGDMIIKSYKKENPEEQSMWATDTSRLSFIVRQLFEETGKNEWVSDRSGLKIKSLIIKPLLTEIKKKLRKYIAKCAKIGKDASNALIYMDRMYNSNRIILDISKGNLDNEILRYIAPSFGLDLALAMKTGNTIKCIKCTKLFSVYELTKIKKKHYCKKCLEKFFSDPDSDDDFSESDSDTSSNDD